MKLYLFLNDSKYIEIFNFEKVVYWHNGTFETILTDNLDNLILRDNATYKFYGKNKVVITGSQIKYLELI